MGLVLNDEQLMLRDAANELLAERAPVSALRELRDTADADGFSRDLWRELAELGWTGMDIAEAYGGSEFGFTGLGVAMEACGRNLSATPLLATVVLGAELVQRLGTEAQKQALLPRVLSGELLLSLALDELARHRPSNIATRATATDSGFRLDGSKCFVLDGHVADILLVVARSAGAQDQDDGLSLFLVESNSPGLKVERLSMVDSRNAARVQLSGVSVAPEALLGELGAVGNTLDAVLDNARVALAAEMLGGAQEAFDRTIAYLKMREQFGVLIGSFQALKHRAALMLNELELTRSAVYEALEAIEQRRDDAALLASLAKAQACNAYELISAEAIQMHGGIGMTDDEEIGFYLKRARVAQQTFGDASFHRDRYARLSGF